MRTRGSQLLVSVLVLAAMMFASPAAAHLDPLPDSGEDVIHARSMIWSFELGALPDDQCASTPGTPAENAQPSELFWKVSGSGLSTLHGGGDLRLCGSVEHDGHLAGIHCPNLRLTGGHGRMDFAFHDHPLQLSGLGGTLSSTRVGTLPENSPLVLEGAYLHDGRAGRFRLTGIVRGGSGPDCWDEVVSDFDMVLSPA